MWYNHYAMIITYKKWQKNILISQIILVLFGFMDSIYLTYQKITNNEVACSTSGCNTVINSDYAYLIGVPLAYLGVIYYLTLVIIMFFVLKNKKPYWLKLLTLITISGFFMSGYFVYLQLFEIGSICIYCMFSALTSTLLFIFTQILYWTTKKAAN